MLSQKTNEVSLIGTPPLIKIREVLSELAGLIDNVVSRDAASTGDTTSAAGPVDASISAPVDPSLVEAFINTRKARNAFFPKNWFSDPSWEILLFLFLAHLKDDGVTVGSLSNGTDSRPTTTIRWIDIMESYQLVSRSRCTLDSRRVYVKLAQNGVDAMTNYFATIAGLQMHS